MFEQVDRYLLGRPSDIVEHGGVAERTNAPALRAGGRKASWVQIPSPPSIGRSQVLQLNFASRRLEIAFWEFLFFISVLYLRLIGEYRLSRQWVYLFQRCGQSHSNRRALLGGETSIGLLSGCIAEIEPVPRSVELVEGPTVEQADQEGAPVEIVGTVENSYDERVYNISIRLFLLNAEEQQLFSTPGFIPNLAAGARDEFVEPVIFVDAEEIAEVQTEIAYDRE